MEKNIKVCVTGGAGNLASWLVKELLERGYTVHATLRNLGDESKVGVLKGLPHADTRLKLFKADIYNPHEFAPAIQGCEVVMHVATPMLHDPQSSQYKNTTEASVDCVKKIMEACINSGTVKKFIYTGSLMAASPLMEDGSGYKDSVDETCWTTLNDSNANVDDYMKNYVLSKKGTEEEVLSYQGRSNVEVITLPIGSARGETLLPSIPQTWTLKMSQINGDHKWYKLLRAAEDIMGKMPILHITDVARAHIFCMENPVPSGRYLCANGFLKTSEIAEYYLKHNSDVKIAKEFMEDTMRTVSWGSTKLEDLGFHYKYDVKMTLDETLKSARRMGYLN